MLTGRQSVDASKASRQAGLTKITFRNDARGEHEAQLVRVEGEQSEAEVLRQFGHDRRGRSDAATGCAPPAAPARPAAGQEVSSTQVLVPGTYYAIDTS